MSKSELGMASILPKIIQLKGHLRVFLHLFWQPTVYIWRTHWKRTRMSRKRLLLLDAWMSLPEKRVFARSNSSGTWIRTRVYPSLPVKFHRVHRGIAYHSCCGSYANVAQQCRVETAAVIIRKGREAELAWQACHATRLFLSFSECIWVHIYKYYIQCSCIRHTRALWCGTNNIQQLYTGMGFKIAKVKDEFDKEGALKSMLRKLWLGCLCFCLCSTQPPQPADVHGTVAPFPPPGSNFVRKYRKCCFHVSRAEFKLSLWKGIELVAVLGPCSCTPCMSNHTAGGSFPYQGMAHRARTLERRGPLAAMNQKCKLHQVDGRGWINDDKCDKWMVVALHSHCGWVYVFMQVLLNWCERVNVKTRK